MFFCNILKLDDAPPHLLCDVPASVNIFLLDGLDDPPNTICHYLSGQSEVLTKHLATFYCEGNVKKQDICSSSTCCFSKLKQHITATITTLNLNMVSRVWVEMDYRLDVSYSHVTKCAHIEHL